MYIPVACRPKVMRRHACISPGRPQHWHFIFTPLPGMNRHGRLQLVVWATAAFHLHTPKLAGPGREIFKNKQVVNHLFVIGENT